MFLQIRHGPFVELNGQRCTHLLTAGDGACAIHAVFGKTLDGRRELFCEHPRSVLRSVLDHPLDVIRRTLRPSHRDLLEAVLSALWTDFVVPYVGNPDRGPPPEESMFLRRLAQSDLSHTVLEHKEKNIQRQRERDDLKRRCQQSSASIFRRCVGRSLWDVLAVQSGFMPLTIIHEYEAESVQQQQEFQYLNPPWEERNGARVVKGTNLPFVPDEVGGPFTKYAALFDDRSAFDSLRMDFVHDACSRRLEHLADRLHEITVAEIECDPVTMEAVSSYICRFGAYFDFTPAVTDSPLDFSSEVGVNFVHVLLSWMPCL